MNWHCIIKYHTIWHIMRISTRKERITMKKETGDTIRFEDVSEIGAVIRALESAKEQSEESRELVKLLDQMLINW